MLLTVSDKKNFFIFFFFRIFNILIFLISILKYIFSGIHFSDTSQIKQDGRVPLFNIFTSRLLPIINYIYPRMAARQGGTLLKVHGQNFEKSRYLRCNFNSAEKNSNNDTKQNIALHGKTSMSSIHLSQCVTNDVGAIDLKHGRSNWNKCNAQSLRNSAPLDFYHLEERTSSVLYGKYFKAKRACIAYMEAL